MKNQILLLILSITISSINLHAADRISSFKARERRAKDLKLFPGRLVIVKINKNVERYASVVKVNDDYTATVNVTDRHQTIQTITVPLQNIRHLDVIG